MIEIEREVFTKDEVFKVVFECIVKAHAVPEHTSKLLFQNRHVKDFCVESRHFMTIEMESNFFIHYDAASWFNGPGRAKVKIERIAFYDSFMEYEAARNKMLHGSKDSDIPNIN